MRLLAVAIITGGCVTHRSSSLGKQAEAKEVLSAEKSPCEVTCLREQMARAVAIEVIEADCRNRCQPSSAVAPRLTPAESAL